LHIAVFPSTSTCSRTLICLQVYVLRDVTPCRMVVADVVSPSSGSGSPRTVCGKVTNRVIALPHTAAARSI
jgi:hypothetical protein